MPKSDTAPITRVVEPGVPLPKVQTHPLERIDYQTAWDKQGRLHKEMVALKLGNRDRLKAGEAPLEQTHHLLYVEHPPVYTLGKSGSIDHLLMNEKQLAAGGFTYHKINRGGDITYHGPNQLVVYPIFDLDEFFTDVHRYVRCLEEVIIRTLADYGINNAYREAGYTGVWLPATDKLPKRKICAIGVHLSRWVTMHGLAFNVNPDLGHFNNIIPCGIAETDRSVTSLSKELGKTVTLTEIQPIVDRHFRQVFGY